MKTETRVTKQNVLLILSLLLTNIIMALHYGWAGSGITYVSHGDWNEIKLFTTHFSHHGIGHLSGNLIALILLFYLFPNDNKTVIISFALCMVLIALYVQLKSIHAFLGFSSLLYCLPGCYWTQSLIKKKFWISWLVPLILLGYIYLTNDQNQVMQKEWQTLTAGHLIGFASGCLTVIFLNHQNLMKPKSPINI